MSDVIAEVEPVVLDAWITKWALRHGIFKTRVMRAAYNPEVAIDVSGVSSPGRETYGPDEWWLNREEAIHAANLLRFQKLEVLISRVDQLMELNFERDTP